MILKICIRSLFVIHTHRPAGGYLNDISSPAFNLTYTLSCYLVFMCPRKPCLMPSTYSTLGTTSSVLSAGNCPPIWVADKPKRCQRLNNVFVDDRGFPDKSKYYENLLHNIDGGPILCKLKHSPPSLDEVDPKFFSAYDKSKHGAQLKKDLNLSHLEPSICNQIYALVKKYWSVAMTRVFSSQSRTMSVSLILGMQSPLPSKRYSMGPGRSLSCRPPLLLPRKSAIYDR